MAVFPGATWMRMLSASAGVDGRRSGRVSWGREGVTAELG